MDWSLIDLFSPKSQNLEQLNRVDFETRSAAQKASLSHPQKMGPNQKALRATSSLQ